LFCPLRPAILLFDAQRGDRDAIAVGDWVQNI
jgi:hypothetical protein